MNAFGCRLGEMGWRVDKLKLELQRWCCGAPNLFRFQGRRAD
jgi:hypothetical protein